MEQKKLVPKRRFKEYSGECKEQRLGDLAEIVRGASPRPIQNPKWFDNNSNVGWLRISDVTEQNGRINYLEQRLSSLGQEKTRVLNEPHLLLSIAATVGKPVINYVETGVHDGFLIFKSPKFDREFMFQWLEMFRPMWSKYGQPGSQVNLNSSIVKEQKIVMPNLEKQQKIGLFFKHLDEMITLEQRKIDKTKALKSAYLAEMFPAEGERVPKRRFAGFTDDWKLFKLKDLIVSEDKGRARAEMMGDESTYLDANYLNGGENLTVDSPSNVNPDDVLILWDGSHAGKVYHGFEGALGSTLKALQPVESGSFIYYYLFFNEKKILEQYRTPNIPHVINTFTDEFMISKPNLDEQLKIGDFFKKIDGIITNHQCKLDKLKATKQAYLHEMFV